MKTKNKNQIKKSKRMRHRFNDSSEVAQLWANQSQDRAHCRNVFFECDRIYSYGWHFLLGRIIEFRGQKIALLNESHYSKTTRSHQWDAFFAAKNAKLIPIMTDSENISDGIIAKIIKAHLIKKQNELIDRLQSFNFFGICNYEQKDFMYDLNEFNSHCKSLGFIKLCLRIPANYFRLPKELGKLNELIYCDRESRKLQSLSSLVASNNWYDFFGFNYRDRMKLSDRVV